MRPMTRLSLKARTALTPLTSIASPKAPRAARLARAIRGAGLVEYGLLTGLVAVVAIGAVSGAGERIEAIFADTGEALSDSVISGVASAPGAAPSAPTTNPPAAAECYDPANEGTVGQPGWTGCEGMLIVDDATLRGAASGFARPAGGYESSGYGGDESYAIEEGGVTYTFNDSANNVFTGQVTDMSYLFQNTSFNGDIGYWDTSNVTVMSAMFFNNALFDQDIGGWDVSNVQVMSSMFRNATAFDQDIGYWDVSNVGNFGSMFRNATAFNQDIGDWDVTNATSFYRMFSNADAFDQDIGGWNVSNVTDMRDAFQNADNFNQDLSSWPVSGVTSCGDFDNGASSWTAAKPNFTSCTP